MNAKRILASVLACLVLMMSMTALASAEGTAVEVATYDDLVAAVANGGEIKLTDDISYHNSYTNNKSIKIDTGTNVTLDLNGHSLGQYVWDNGASVAAVIVREGATLTIKDTSEAKTGKVQACSCAIQLEGTLNLESGKISIENPSNYDKTPGQGFAYGVWFYMRSADAQAPVFNMTGGSINICDEMLEAHKELDWANAIAFDSGTEGVAECYNNAVVNITGGTLNSNIVAGTNAENITVPESVEVVYYGAVAEVGGVNYTSLANAVAAAEANATITILSDVELTEKIEIRNAVEIVGGNNTITTSAQKLFEVYADFSVSDLKMESTNSAGRCVDTRVGNIEVSIDNCELKTLAGDETAQAVTVGGNETTKKVTLNITDTTIESEYTGIIMWIPADVTVTNSSITGWSAIYAKGLSGAETSGSTITVKNSDLKSVSDKSGTTQEFGAISLEDDGVTVSVDADSSITVDAKGTATQSAINFYDGTENTVTLNCPVTLTGDATVVVRAMTDNATLVVTDEAVIEMVKSEGYAVSENGTVSIPDVSWKTDADAGFYFEEETKYGVLRFLFAVDTMEEIVDSGIKYIRIADKDAAGTMSDSGTAASFYGDVYGIPESEAGNTYYAVAYVTTSSGTEWSEVVACTVDMTNQQFTDYVAGGAQ